MLTEPGTAGVGGQAQVLSPVELLSLVTNRTSAFVLDVTLDKFDGGHYGLGEKLTVSGTSEKAGYLYLYYLDGEGRLAVMMFPAPGADNRIPARTRFEFPAAGTGAWRTFGAPGTHRIKAVVTSIPLIMSGLLPVDEGSTGPRTFHLPPSQRAMFQEVLGKHRKSLPIAADELGGISPEQFVGEFAQDEVAFYVGPAAAAEEGQTP